MTVCNSYFSLSCSLFRWYLVRKIKKIQFHGPNWSFIWRTCSFNTVPGRRPHQNCQNCRRLQAAGLVKIVKIVALKSQPWVAILRDHTYCAWRMAKGEKAFSACHICRIFCHTCHWEWSHDPVPISKLRILGTLEAQRMLGRKNQTLVLGVRFRMLGRRDQTLVLWIRAITQRWSWLPSIGGRFEGGT